MTAAVIWLIVGIVLVVAELASGAFVLAMLGAAALAAAGAGAVGAPVPVQVAVFAVTAALTVFAARPALKRRLDRGVDSSAMHTSALVGRTAVVVSRVDGHGGRVRIDGDLWSAKAHDGVEVIEEGQRATVLDISGATALVVSQA